MADLNMWTFLLDHDVVGMYFVTSEHQLTRTQRQTPAAVQQEEIQYCSKEGFVEQTERKTEIKQLSYTRR